MIRIRCSSDFSIPATRTARFLAAAGASLFGVAAQGQCVDWRPEPGLYGSANVTASEVWDPDGAGPQAPLLVAGGVFDHVGDGAGPRRDNIAAWDGSNWQALGAGVGPNITGFVDALAVYNGELIAAGNFPTAGTTAASNIARWNGTVWQSLGSGINGEVYALTVRGGELIAGGSFSTAGGVAAANIARWNGTTWSALGTGISGGSVRALAVLQNNELVAAGTFSGAGGNAANRIARWNGTTWILGMNGGVTGGVTGSNIRALKVRANGDLIVGGEFTMAGTTPVNNIARWTAAGGWSAMHSGMFTGSPVVLSLTEFNGQVFAGGRFGVAGDLTCNGIARWTETDWQPLLQGIPQTNLGNFVQSLAVFNNELIVCGSFPAVNGTMLARSMARWNGSAWLSMPGFVCARNMFLYTLTNWGPNLVISGDFPTLSTNLTDYSRHLVAWDGATEYELGNPNNPVYATASMPGLLGGSDLIVGGAFTSINGVGLSQVGRLVASNGTWSAMGSGFSGNPVFSLLYNPDDGFVYATGGFTTSGATTLNGVARWNGSTWQAMGTGLNGTGQCLKNYNGAVYVGGFFTTAGGVSTGGLARWTGAVWQPVGGVFSGSVKSLEVFQNKLIIGGTFPGINSSPSIVAYDGLNYSTLGSGGARLADNTQATVNALTVSNGTLIAGGTFATMSGIPTRFLARWNGSFWTEVGGGVQAQVRCLGSYKNEIQVGGDFAFVNNNTVLSPMWARFSEGGAPWIAQQPLPVSTTCGQTANFTTQAALGYPVTYQWRRAGIPLVNGPTGTGTTISGATSATLTLSNVGSIDAASYDCILSNTCGTVTSAAAALTINSFNSLPTIQVQPLPATACPGGSASFTVGATPGNGGPLAYQWRKNGVPLTNSPGSISGATSATLTILNATAASAGAYDCWVTSGCPGRASNSALLTFCYANCDCSTVAPVLTANDFQCFLNKFALSDPAANCDGSTTPPLLTANDFQCFLNTFATGCP